MISSAETPARHPLLDDLHWRGLIHQCTDESVASAAFTAGTSAYIGFDPTAASLHVGSLQQIMLLRRLQLAGQRPIALVGGGTGMIGDPSGKSAERSLQTLDTIAANAEGIRAQLAQFLDFEGEGAAKLVNNLDWLGGLGLIEFLRDVGKHFSVNAMMQRDSVRTRLESREQGISYTEFSYMLLQAYDFFVLHRDHGCAAQLGGSDQWGNIVSGVDLIRRLGPAGDQPNQRPAPFGLTSPLVTNRSGTKFGKTEQGTIWLDPARTSPYALYQFWLSSEDADVSPFLRRFTLLPRDEIEALERRHGDDPSQRIGQRALATEVVRLAHGDDGLHAAERATTALFTGDIAALTGAELRDVFADVPSATIDAEAWAAEGHPLRTLLVGEGLAFASNGEAKRKLQEGAVRINGHKVSQGVGDRFDPSGLKDGSLAVVRVGRKATWLVHVGQATTSNGDTL